MVSIDLNSRDLVLDQSQIEAGMGCGKGSELDQFTLDLITELTEELLSIAKPKYCYTIEKEIDFKYGKIISDALCDGDRYAIVVATAGQEVDDLLAHYRDSDIVKAFIADTIASEMAEATIRAAVEGVTSTLEEGENISNAYAPGYCGWLLKEQGKLFSYFESAPCSIELTDSFLMLPIKSVSSVLAIGKNVEKKPYGCDVCTKTDCYKKRNKATT